MSKQIHVTPKGDGWQVKNAGAERATKLTSTKQEAVNVGTQIAKNNSGELVIHGKNGQIQNKNSFGNDPFPPRDSK